MQKGLPENLSSLIVKLGYNAIKFKLKSFFHKIMAEKDMIFVTVVTLLQKKSGLPLLLP